MKYELVIETGPNIGRKIPMKKQTATIGRDKSADICIKDGEISRKHCRLIRGSSYQIQDLGSTNGTYVDGERLGFQEIRELTSGQIVQIGANVQLLYTELREEDDSIMSTMIGAQAVGQMAGAAKRDIYATQVKNVVAEPMATNMNGAALHMNGDSAVHMNGGSATQTNRQRADSVRPNVAGMTGQLRSKPVQPNMGSRSPAADSGRPQTGAQQPPAPMANKPQNRLKPQSPPATEETADDEQRRKYMFAGMVGGGVLLGCCALSSIGGGVAYYMGLIGS